MSTFATVPTASTTYQTRPAPPQAFIPWGMTGEDVPIVEFLDYYLLGTERWAEAIIATPAHLNVAVHLDDVIVAEGWEDYITEQELDNDPEEDTE